MRSACVALLMALVVVYAAIPPVAMLSVESKGPTINATIVVANNSDFELAIESYNVFADGKLTNRVFTVECDGRNIQYSGPMVKRRRPVAEDYVRIPAHARRSFTTDLAKSYSFPSGHYSCSVVYEAICTLPAKDSFFTLRSNAVVFSR